MVCEKCGKEFDNDWRKKTSRWKPPRFCSKQCASSRSFSQESLEKKSKASKIWYASHKHPGRKDLKEFECTCINCGAIFYRAPGKTKKTCSDDCKREIFRKNNLKRGFGGHTSKISLKYFSPFAGEVFLQSSWETACARLLDSLEIPWIRPQPLWWVDSLGAKHRYYADFYMV